jgi:glycosyltransferase involved in cell wall biosynthesis
MEESTGQQHSMISIVINNYNYERFVDQAIESSFSQNFEDFEVILVDDGSTDHSMAIAERHSPGLRIVRKENGGQASAFNAGFAASKGDWILFLDSDDWLKPDALAKIASATAEGISKIHFLLQSVHDRNGIETPGGTLPMLPLSEGNAVEVIRQFGDYSWPPTSGNVFSRKALEKIMPMNEQDYRLCADLYLCMKVTEHGNVRAIQETLGFYRIHGGNGHAGFSLEPIKLFRKCLGLIQHQQLADEVTGSRAGEKVWHYRAAVETALLTRRFCDCSSITGKFPLLADLLRLYLQSVELQNATLRARFVGFFNWVILRFGPPCLIKRCMEVRLRRARTAVSANSGKLAYLNS